MAVTATNAGNRTNKKLTFKNKAQFRSCNWKRITHSKITTRQQQVNLFSIVEK